MIFMRPDGREEMCLVEAELQPAANRPDEDQLAPIFDRY